MTYPPPSGPPGAPGWPGDPNQMPPSDPYGGQPGGGFPQQPDPYAPPGGGMPPASPPQYDPYGQPSSGAPAGYQPGYPGGGFPPSQPSDPYHSPSSGGPGGYPPPGYPGGGLPQMPTPKQGGGNTGWIVGGIVGVVVILLVTVGALFMTGVIGGGDDSGTTAGETGDGTDTGESEGTEEATGGTYKYVDGFCETIDMSQLQAGMEESQPVTDMSSDSGESMSCMYTYATEDYGYAVVTVTADVGADEAEALASYESMIEWSFLENPEETTLEGDWDNGVVMIGGNGISDTSVYSFATTGNLALQVGVAGTDMPYGESDIPAMNLALMEEILTLTAA
ncbi:hypothetical protein LX16_5127 [Stackebrandtia albiflava]|uniref:Uncharacterized protein n=1 Tax=Stackebrandtia albiflava TaxID=406432 RepID=A0A562UPU3_9ACTN|nr:hypothetical protein [Stackebrandtia albiflava]TWJ07641.1 hypothetical protein LX16_5127 [Stackebrandtia albiflava]